MHRRPTLLAILLSACNAPAAAPEPSTSASAAPACTLTTATELTAYDDARAAVDAYEEAHRRRSAAACADILRRLGGEEPAMTLPPTLDDATRVCAAALAAVEARQAAGATVHVEERAAASCKRDAAKESACVAACGNAAGCAVACDAQATFGAICTPPVLVVRSSDAALQAALAPNLPAIRAVVEGRDTVGAKGAEVATAIAALRQQLAGHDTCAAEDERLATAAAIIMRSWTATTYAMSVAVLGLL
jgi:hypothetical protein